MLSGVESPVVTPRRPLVGAPRPCCAGSRAKRMLDIALSAVLLTALLPLMTVIGLAVAVSSAGPIVFRQTRVGLGERPFTVLKFRTMYHNAAVRLVDVLQADGREPSSRTTPRHDARTTEADPFLAKPRQDTRITAVGRFLRKASLDELPQLVNVLRGDMSLVGPRPCPHGEHTTLNQEDRVKRVSVKPGMTGLWQVSGRSTITAEKAIQLDLQYVDHWSLRLDLLILLRTLPAVLRTRHAW